MKRQIITIDEEKCDGCGICVTACHEGAIGLVGGKARLLRDDYCDGMGDCLPECPTGAITWEEREAAPYNEAAVLAAKLERARVDNAQAQTVKTTSVAFAEPAGGCPGSRAMTFERHVPSSGVSTPLAGSPQRASMSSPYNSPTAAPKPSSVNSSAVSFFNDVPSSLTDENPSQSSNAADTAAAFSGNYALPTVGVRRNGALDSELSQWPVQIKLVSPSSSFFQGCHLLIATDCTAFAYADFHRDYLTGRVALIGCPKLDAVDYTEKLSAILSLNDVRDVVVARMSVPCCGGIEMAVRRAIEQSGKDIPLHVTVIDTNGDLLS